jgi:hypothetical protein
MDEGHSRVAWPPHSYDKISFIQERYKSVEMASQIVIQISPLPALVHKAPKVYEFSSGPS